MGDKGWWERIFDERFFLETLDYMDSDATHKINGFSVQYSSTSVKILTEFKKEEIELVVAEEYNF